MVWLSIFKKFGLKNIRSMTEFISFTLSEYLVGTWLVGLKKIRSKESTMYYDLKSLEWNNDMKSCIRV